MLDQTYTPTTSEQITVPGIDTIPEITQPSAPIPSGIMGQTQSPTQPQAPVNTPAPATVDESNYEGPIGALFQDKKYTSMKVSKDKIIDFTSKLPMSIDEGRSHPFDENYDGAAKVMIIYSNAELPEFSVPSYATLIKTKQEQGWTVRIAWTNTNLLGMQLATKIHNKLDGRNALEIYTPWSTNDLPASIGSAMISEGPSFESLYKNRQIVLHGLKNANDEIKAKFLGKMRDENPTYQVIFEALDFEVAYGYNLNQKASLFITYHEIYTDFKVFREANTNLFYTKDKYTSKFKFNIPGVNLKTKSAMQKLS